MNNQKIELTKESDYLICKLYKEYLQRRMEKIPKTEAKCFGSSAKIRSELMPDALYEDVDETCRELERAGLLKCQKSDFDVLDSEFTDKAIIYMENRFSNNLKEIADNLSRIKQFINPFS